MIHLTLEPEPGGMAALRCGYDAAAIAQFKTMPGCKWNPDRRVWTAPAEAALILAKRLERAQIASTVKNGLGVMPVSEPCIDDDLYHYQQEGVKFIASRTQELGSALLADDMGVGKSVQSLRAIDWLDPDYSSRVLILCPAIVVGHWQDEIERWSETGSERLSKKCPDWAGFGVVSYDTFRSLSKTSKMPKADIVVLDELHYLSNSRSQRSKAVAAYLKVSEPKAIIGLSGTPMMVRPRDLWHPLNLLWPDRFGTYYKFTARYCEGHYETIPGVAKEIWQCDGASNIEELSERLKPLMLRRTRSEVLELPDRQRIVIGVELPKKAQKSLSKALADVRDGDSVQKVLGAAEEHKLGAAVELAEDLLAQGHRPLILTTRRKTAHDLGEALKCPAVTGEDPPGNRRSCLLSQGGAAVATIYSVTTGINLTEFDSAIFVGLDWVPSTLLQAEARLHRIGQKKSVLYYYLIGLGSIDEVVRSRVIERLDHFISLMGGDKNSDQADLAGALDDSSEDLIGQIVSMVKEMT